MGLIEEQDTVVEDFTHWYPIFRFANGDAFCYDDRNGRIVYTNNRSLTNVGFSRKEWEAVKDAPEGVFTRSVTAEMSYQCNLLGRVVSVPPKQMES